MMALFGIILGIGSGVGTALLQEAADRSARRSEDLMMVFPFPVLAELPEIVTTDDMLRKRKQFRILAGTAFVFLIIFVMVIHFFVMDLDVLWVRAARRLA